MYAILPAAGSGSRMGQLRGNVSKVMLPLRGESSVLELSLKAVVESGAVKGIVIVARAADIAEVRETGKRAAPDFDISVVEGGSTRQESVYRGLLELDGKANFVLVHDAARPFCSPQLVAQTAEVGVACGACIAAIPAKASLKRVHEGHIISHSIRRAEIWEAQTPQVFSYAVLREAHEKARAENYLGTDESELVERLGHQVKIVPGEESNIKITTPYDLEYAEQRLAGRNLSL